MSKSPINLPEVKEQAATSLVPDKDQLHVIRKMSSTPNSHLFLARRGKTMIVNKVPRIMLEDTKATQEIVDSLINEYNAVRGVQKLNGQLSIMFPLRDVAQTSIRVLGIEYPFMSGGDLFDWVDHHKRLPESNVREFLGPIASTLAWLHDNRFAHRDIKPENILMDGLGKTYLADFAFAKQYSSKDCREYVAKGTEAYVGPEFDSFLVETRGYNPFAADVWALGITLLNAATRSAAYDKCGDAYFKQLVQFVASEQLPARFGKLSPSLLSLLLGMLHADPAKRLTMQQVVAHEWWSGGEKVKEDHSSLPSAQ